MLPAQYRMTRSTDFGLTVNKGVRAAQPDLVVHALRTPDEASGVPKIGLVVSKSVGSSVERHAVSRRLRHVARGVIADLQPGDLVVIRALPGSSRAASTRLDKQLRSALRRVGELEASRR